MVLVIIALVVFAILFLILKFNIHSKYMVFLESLDGLVFARGRLFVAIQWIAGLKLDNEETSNAVQRIIEKSKMYDERRMIDSELSSDLLSASANLIVLISPCLMNKAERNNEDQMELKSICDNLHKLQRNLQHSSYVCKANADKLRCLLSRLPNFIVCFLFRDESNVLEQR
jgi:lysylphosphatidylglycerol synthetase-like protein (DUF2156 family)